MSWIPLAFASHTAWSLANITDKYVVSNITKNPYFYMGVVKIFGFSVLLLIPFVDFQIPTLTEFLWLLLGSVLVIINYFSYIKAADLEDITRINILWNLIPVFGLIIGWLTIGETLSPKELSAMAILLTGSILASIHIRKTNIKFSKAFFLMLMACLSYAFYIIIVRHLSSSLNFSTIFITSKVIIALIVLSSLSLSRTRKAITPELKILKPKFLTLFFMAFALDAGGTWLSTWALSEGKAALVFSMEGTQPILVFAITLLLSFFTKINLKEELDKSNLILKFCAIIVIMVGIYTLHLL